MARKVDGVILGMKTFLKDPWRMVELDCQVVPIPWNEKMFSPKRKLKIGWFKEDGYFPLTPACARAVDVAVEALERAGCEVVYFKYV